MRPAEIAWEALTPGILVTLQGYLDHRCMISPKARVELTLNLRIGGKSMIGSFTNIESKGGPLHIGARVDIATACTIASDAGGIHIGDDCLIGPGVCILGDSRGPSSPEADSLRGIRIADNVWIGANCTILEGADIGSGAIVTPGSVVSFRLPENAIAQGNPAKVIFTRR